MNGICTMVTVLGEPAEPQPNWLQAVLVAMVMLLVMTALEEGEETM